MLSASDVSFYRWGAIIIQIYLPLPLSAMLAQEKEMRTKMDVEENIRDKMLVDEIVRKTIEEDEKFVVFLQLT